MPKKIKTEETNAAAPAEPVTEPTAATETSAPRKSAAKKTSGKKGAPSRSAAQKTGAKKAARKSAGKRTVEPTDDQIAIRAYFIAERRLKTSQHGDPNQDWIQAREELLAELNKNGSAQKNGSH